MGNRMGKVILGACVAASAALVLTGCGNAYTDTNKDELSKRGFTDIVESSYEENNEYYGGDYATYFGNAGGCRVVLQWLQIPDMTGHEWMLVERSSKGEDSDVVLPNPTAAKVGELDAFQHCYNIEPESAEQ